MALDESRYDVARVTTGVFEDVYEYLTLYCMPFSRPLMKLTFGFFAGVPGTIAYCAAGTSTHWSVVVL